MPQVELLLQPNADGDEYLLMQLLETPKQRPGKEVLIELETSMHHRIVEEATVGVRIQPWGQTDYLKALSALATELDQSLAYCARRFGTVSVPENDDGWRSHPALGFTKKR